MDERFSNLPNWNQEGADIKSMSIVDLCCGEKIDEE